MRGSPPEIHQVTAGGGGHQALAGAKIAIIGVIFVDPQQRNSSLISAGLSR
jgi:hypothetical protein